MCLSVFVFEHECMCLQRPKPLASPRVSYRWLCTGYGCWETNSDPLARESTSPYLPSPLSPALQTQKLQPLSVFNFSIFLAVNTQWNEQLSVSVTGLSTPLNRRHETLGSFNFLTSQFSDYFCPTLLSLVSRSLTTVFTAVALKDSVTKWVLFLSLPDFFFF